MKNPRKMSFFVLIAVLAVSACAIMGEPGDSTVSYPWITGVTAPVYGGTPVTEITETYQYTGTVSWSGAPATFEASTVYTATITLTAKSGYTFKNVSSNFFTIYGATTVTNTAGSGVVTAVFPATESTYSVTYNSNGASGGTVPLDDGTYADGQSITVLGNPGNLVKCGNENIVWNTEPDGSGTTFFEGDSFDAGTANVVLYAWWPELFITKWKTDNPGTSGGTQITIPVYSIETYNYIVDWGDGNSDTGVTDTITHTYDSAGTYTVSISGTFPGIYFNNSGDAQKFLTIANWGNKEWIRMDSAYYGCSNFTYTSKDTPDLSNVTDLSNMFRGVDSFVGDISSWHVNSITNMSHLFSNIFPLIIDLSSWDVSNVTDMSYMFQADSGTTLKVGDLSSWDVSSVTDMSNMFNYDDAFNSDLSSWDVGNVEKMQGMFHFASSFNSDLSSWNVSKVKYFSGMFEHATAFNNDISSWNVGNATHLNLMFYEATSFNGDLSSWDVSSVEHMEYMFYNASAFSNHDLSGWDVNNVTAHGDFSTGWGSGNTEPIWP
ncbi:MAG: BspA family leucine-rich repeat surface protein [Spirochaetales bacterium]|nr:BspA family leucine-rich repeat surface protein [Spirochaetales bacterium]